MSMTGRRLYLWSTYLLLVVAALHTLGMLGEPADLAGKGLVAAMKGYRVYAVYRVTPPLLCFIVLGVTFTASHVLVRRET